MREKNRPASILLSAAWFDLAHVVQRRTNLSCQARPVRQNQIRQCEHDIQFCNLFSQTAVSGFSISKLIFHYNKDMLYLCSHRRFFSLTAFYLRLRACGNMVTLRGTAVDFIVDSITMSVGKNGILLKIYF